jgi:hypothetical protein
MQNLLKLLGRFGNKKMKMNDLASTLHKRSPREQYAVKMMI